MTRTPEESIRLVRLSPHNATRLLPQELTPEVAQACVSAANSDWPQNSEHLCAEDYFEGLDDLCLSFLQADVWLSLELQTDLLKQFPRVALAVLCLDGLTALLIGMPGMPRDLSLQLQPLKQS